MGVEIERKFLVSGDSWRVGKPLVIRQGYLNLDKYRTVRLRTFENEAQLTIKGLTIGMSRSEFEYSIPLEDAETMLSMCVGSIIEKHRWVIPAGEVTWEVDEFFGDNLGLIVAEIELTSENQTFVQPDWVGQEVTNDSRYYNSSLCLNPFSSW